MKAPIFNDMENGITLYKIVDTSESLITTKSYNPNVPLSDIEKTLASVSRDSSGVWRVKEVDNDQRYKILFHSNWSDGLYAFDAIREFNRIYRQIRNWYLRKIQEQVKNDDATISQALNDHAYGKSLFYLHDRYPLEWALTYAGDDGSGHGDINEYNSLFLKINVKRPVTADLPKDSCQLPLTEEEFTKILPYIFEIVEREGFFRIEALTNTYLYNRGFHTTTIPYFIAEKIIEQYDENDILETVKNIRLVFENSDLGAFINLSAFVRDGNQMIYTPYYLYKCEAADPIIRDNFGNHQRNIIIL